jgi:hypothetical protein
MKKTSRRKPQHVSPQAPEQRQPGTVSAPEYFLFRNDDVTIPMNEAAQALEFLEELFTALSDSKDVQFCERSWEYLSRLAWEARRNLEDAEARVRAQPGDLLVPDARFTSRDLALLWAARRDRERAATTAASSPDEAVSR